MKTDKEIMLDCMKEADDILKTLAIADYAGERKICQTLIALKLFDKQKVS